MLQKDQSNTLFQLASDLVNDTSQHIFLTGKAGTGKTTFLRSIVKQTKKNAVIVAPTGVAAINAGGVTMHSFFQLPRGMFIPGIVRRDDFIGFADVNDRHSLFRNIHFTSNKRELLQELELLIIDEVSMMRCDMLDAIDTILRHFRRMPQVPFGGVQVLYIGDLFQLPPVVSGDEWSRLQEFYTSPFFFSAKVVAEAPPLYIELKKIYRQSEQQFIDVLNRIRNNQPTREDFDFLNRRYDPHFVSKTDDHYITVTTHNKKADSINISELNKLPGTLYSFKAEVKNEFSDKAFPTELDLQLKEGAQIMFIKNDSNPERRYYNGKLASVKRIRNEEIVVSFTDGSGEITLEKETWKNVRYIYNRENDDIDEEELGSFTQFPIRLAWAITVHKSQGLTFEKAIIDAGASFAPGQVYVALSRCTSLDGVVLRSRIHASAISTDKRIIEFAQREVQDTNELEAILEREKYKHWSQVLLRVFDWTKVVSALYDWLQLIPTKKLSDTQATMQLAQSLLLKAKEQSEIALKFRRQLDGLLVQAGQAGNTTQLEERMKKAVRFFADALTAELLAPVQEHLSALQYAGRISKYREAVRELEGIIWTQALKLLESSYGDLRFGDKTEYRRFDPLFSKTRSKVPVKEVKGSSQRASFELFRQGKSIEEIAKMRNMAVGTIESHLAPMVRTGQMQAEELVDPKKIEAILQAIEEVGDASAGLIKSRLGDEYSFYEIRVVQNHFRFSQKQSA